MVNNGNLIAFGPVPSRRLGRSLGINNIPSKTCTYSCVYCQLGKTLDMQIERRDFYRVEDIIESVRRKIYEVDQKNERIDFLTFVPDGEPTLDGQLGKEIDLLKEFGIKIAVITNASLLWRKDVIDDLSKADWISVKIDSSEEKIWKRINRPHPKLELGKILDSITSFSQIFDRELVTETMIVNEINDEKDHLEKIADFIANTGIKKSYISIPIRPPAECWVKIPQENKINMAYQIFTEKGIHTEYLIGYEGNDFAPTGDIKEDLLSIISVHPMREDAVKEFLKKAKVKWNIIEQLVEKGEIIELEYNGERFYMRKLSEGGRYESRNKTG